MLMNPRHFTMSGSVAALALLAACGGSKTPEAPASETAVVTDPAPAVETAPVVDAATPVAATENYADFTGDAAAGKVVFIQCQACHVLTEGVNRVGPSLHNKVGKAAGQVEGFKYSEANKNSSIVWTEEKLFEYLKNPRAVIPGTTMAFAGIPDPQKRADLIAFLKVNGEI